MDTSRYGTTHQGCRRGGRRSVITVSRVLSNNGPVRNSVRRRVLEVIERLDYRPNAAARRLRSGDTATIGLIVSDVRNPFFTEVSRAVEDAAHAQGMRVILSATSTKIPRRRRCTSRQGRNPRA